jgi:hypothetical protein
MTVKRLAIAAVATLVFVFCMASSCNMEERMTRKAGDLTDDLMESALDFNRMIAWRYFDDAALSVVPEHKADFLMATQTIYSRVHMEGYKVTFAQVSPVPIPRVRGEVQPPPKDAVKPATPPSLALQDRKTKGDSELDNFEKVPKIWYGMVLVRYQNLNVAPSSRVSSPLIRQYWYWYEDPGVWLVDPEIDQLLDFGRGKPPTATPTPRAQPVVPTP